MVYRANDQVLERRLSNEERKLWSEEKVMKQEEIFLSLNKINRIDDEENVMMYGEEKALIEGNKKAMKSDEC
jgi:hypothetical protein